jgi:hypothetical protein
MMILPMHMGALHPFEQVLTLILAFGPFVVLGAVIVHRRRQDDAELPAGEQVEAQRER